MPTQLTENADYLSTQAQAEIHASVWDQVRKLSSAASCTAHSTGVSQEAFTGPCRHWPTRQRFPPRASYFGGWTAYVFMWALSPPTSTTAWRVWVSTRALGTCSTRPLILKKICFSVLMSPGFYLLLERETFYRTSFVVWSHFFKNTIQQSNLYMRRRCPGNPINSGSFRKGSWHWAREDFMCDSMQFILPAFLVLALFSFFKTMLCTKTQRLIKYLEMNTLNLKIRGNSGVLLVWVSENGKCPRAEWAGSIELMSRLEFNFQVWDFLGDMFRKISSFTISALWRFTNIFHLWHLPPLHTCTPSLPPHLPFLPSATPTPYLPPLFPHSTWMNLLVKQKIQWEMALGQTSCMGILTGRKCQWELKHTECEDLDQMGRLSAQDYLYKVTGYMPHFSTKDQNPLTQ